MPYVPAPVIEKLGATGMSKVFIYGFTGTFTEKPEYDYAHPDVGATHKCMLFLRQESATTEFLNAENEAKKFGFSSITNLAGNQLQIDVLNTEAYKGFTGYYNEALKEGSSLVYYPRT
tara:strand:- start:62 stop:415 length:354 start_codon:yes stop_codon:yes gene_type:complete